MEKSKEDSTGDAATGIQTRSRATTSAVKKVPHKSGCKRKPAPGNDDEDEDEEIAKAGQEATPKKCNLGSGGHNVPKKARTCDKDGDDDGGKQGWKSQRRRKGTSGCDDDVEGSVEGSVDLERSVSEDSHPYAPSFGLRMRFSSLL